jgi:hypothetical protein
MTDLRKFANGQACQVRIPGVCRYDTETTVLAHVRQAGITGGAQKAADLLGSWCCYPCHMAIDGHLETQYERDELRLMHLQGVMRTQEKLIQQGIIRW